MPEPIDLLNDALSSEVGIAVESPELDKLRQKLYIERTRQQRNGNHIFDDISFFEMPSGELWIVRHDAIQQMREQHG